MKMCLCSTFKTDKIFKEANWIVEPKYDGMRCVAIKRDGVVTFKSRNDKEVFNVDIIKQELESLPVNNIVLDGELLSSNWNDTISIVHTQTVHPNKDTLKFYVFDTLLVSDLDSKKLNETLLNRKSRIKEVVSEHIIEVPYYLIETYIQLKKLYSGFLEQGFEGVVLKDTLSKYEQKRSKKWLKLKPEQTYDLEVIGVIEGLGRHVSRLGALICLHHGIKIKVGSGFTDEQRDKFWNTKIVGKTIEVKCQEETKNGYLRFPVFVRVRSDK
jgi:DNA ligase-1